jgi:membrane-bound lytic murein transglycosylase A
MTRRRFRTGIGASAALLLASSVALAGNERPLRIANSQMEPMAWTALDGWAADDHLAAFTTFSNSCSAILNATVKMRAAKPMLDGLYKVCERARALTAPDETNTRAFFEANFRPVRIAPLGESQGFLTGYYESVFAGSRYPSDEYSVPMYRAPVNLVAAGAKRLANFPSSGTKVGRLVRNRKIVQFYDRSAIEDGALAGRGLELCWVKDPVDAFFAQIQGSARVKLDTGGTLRLNYEAHNGQPYYPVGRDLIQRGIVSKEDMSMDRIRDWMTANPEGGKELRRKNRSFVFFRETGLADDQEPIGAQGVPLTTGRSVAVDKNLHVYGTPFWIEAELPIDSDKPETKFRHLMVAQDTGSAIIGPARADIYFGSAENIGSVAGRIKQPGRFAMLVPKELDPVTTVHIPLPPARPKDIPVAAAEPADASPPAESAPEPTTENAAVNAPAGSPLPKPRPKLGADKPVPDKKT